VPSAASAPYYDSAARRHPAIEELIELFANGPLIAALVDRDVKVRYKRSVFGVLWTLVNPLAMLLALSLAFTGVFTRDAPDYPLFVIPALLLWTFIAQTTVTVVREVAAGVDLWRRLRVPKSAMIVATTCTGLINLILSILPVLIVVSLIRRAPGIEIASLPLTVALTAVFVLGLSLFLAAAAVHFPDIADLYSMLLPALMFTAPIVYPRHVVLPRLSTLVALNPVTLYVEAFRAPLYGTPLPSAAGFATMLVVAVAAVVIGWLAFTRSLHDAPYQA
jgi:ABC-2 type transport system permease protein